MELRLADMTNVTLKVGDLAPDFELMNQDMEKVKLSSLRGKQVVLLFYPMDFSPVCEKEFCTFGPDVPKVLAGRDTVVFGVSCDSPFSHAVFKRQLGIPVDLLSDTSRKMSKAYGMWSGEEPFNCTKRGTVVIDKEGRVSHYEDVGIPTVRTTAQLTKAMGN